MTRRHDIQCVHEPFGDAFYYGPERLSDRFEADEQARIDSGFSQSTFKTVLDRLEREASQVRLPFFFFFFLFDFTFLFFPCSIPASWFP